MWGNLLFCDVSGPSDEGEYHGLKRQANLVSISFFVLKILLTEVKYILR